jgi:ATP-binding cassette subfamily F protein uup
MDRLVDHLFVFEGDGVIKDFPGNYSQYRETQKNAEPEAAEKKKEGSKGTEAERPKRRLSYKDQRELEALEKELAELEKERKDLYDQLNNGSLPYAQLQQLTGRINTINESIDTKELRWLQLSENLT